MPSGLSGTKTYEEGEQMGERMNVVALRILLFYFYSPLQWDMKSAAEQDAMIWLDRAGLIQPQKGETPYAITERGRVHVEALLEAPLPKQTWVSPINNKEEP